MARVGRAAARGRKHAGGEMEPSGAPEQTVSRRLQAVRQRRLPGPVGPDDGDEQPRRPGEPSYHPGAPEPRPQRQSPRRSATSFDQAPDISQRRHRVRIRLRALVPMPFRSRERGSKQGRCTGRIGIERLLELSEHLRGQRIPLRARLAAR